MLFMFIFSSPFYAGLFFNNRKAVLLAELVADVPQPVKIFILNMYFSITGIISSIEDNMIMDMPFVDMCCYNKLMVSAGIFPGKLSAYFQRLFRRDGVILCKRLDDMVCFSIIFLFGSFSLFRNDFHFQICRIYSALICRD